VSDESLGSQQFHSADDYVSEFNKVFTNKFNWQGNDDMRAIVSEIGAAVPLLICNAPGYRRVRSCGRYGQGFRQRFVFLGSAVGFDTAESLVTTASKRGTWVLLKNVHLCTEWLSEIFVQKKQTFGQSTHQDFRLFVTSEISPKVPTALLRLSVSDAIVAEASTFLLPRNFFAYFSKPH
jgi:dynein heavy chain 1, cytosolic